MLNKNLDAINYNQISMQNNNLDIINYNQTDNNAE